MSAPHKTPTPDKATPDWERIEADYRAGLLSLREIAGGSGVSHVTISKRAKRDGWDKDLSAKIKSKAEALVNTEGVNRTVNSNSALTDKAIVDANAQAIASIRLGHRGDIRRGRSVVASLFDELELICGPDNAAMLAELGEIMREPDERGQDKRSDAYSKLLSLSGRVKTAKELGEALKSVIALEREAFGLNDQDATTPPFGAVGHIPASVTVIHVAPPPRTPDDEDDS